MNRIMGHEGTDLEAIRRWKSVPEASQQHLNRH